ncbi:HIT domain-containing protein [Algiphilus aromaticivorans]|jgi:diadenosine tetraphosphate (Ap4A) HIT family hydrolase|uniref:HIT domain-containing protein n=1 Tax=Algiphilus aromaticivorans TaxID=382454 RepID=UPI0006937046|nr:HIT family protein [Algiphilus aromaticivorans]
MNDFVLDARLQRDCLHLADFPLCRLLMMDDARFPWFLLVPRIPGARDAIDLDTEDYRRLWEESADLCRAIRIAFTPHKLNVAALGNQVAQLHVHHIARYQGDDAWPAPVWGYGEAQACGETVAKQRSSELLDALPGRLRP